MSATENLPGYRELSSRSADGLTVVLYWRKSTGETALYLQDQRTGKDDFFNVPPSSANDAFRHPFAYLSAESYVHAESH